MLVGYARTSTVEQAAGLAAQRRDLKAAGCEKIFAEQVSSVAERAKLTAALEFVREGDVLVVTKPDRLARSTRNLLDIVEDLERRGIALVVLSMGGQRIDTRSPTGKLMLTMLGAIATFERDLMLERQREGIAKAAAEGKYKGRAPTARARQLTCCGWRGPARHGMQSRRSWDRRRLRVPHPGGGTGDRRARSVGALSTRRDRAQRRRLPAHCRLRQIGRHLPRLVVPARRALICASSAAMRALICSSVIAAGSVSDGSVTPAAGPSISLATGRVLVHSLDRGALEDLEERRPLIGRQFGNVDAPAARLRARRWRIGGAAL